MINRFWLQRMIHWSLYLCLALLVACSPGDTNRLSSSLHSLYSEEQPALSGNGHDLAFVSNRNGNQQLLLYNFPQAKFIPLPGLNRPHNIVENPSLSYTGRYITYLTSDYGRPVVAMYDRATKQSQILTPIYTSWLRNPRISPDGRYVVFETAKSGQWDIEVLDRGPEIELDLPNGASVDSSAP